MAQTEQQEPESPARVIAGNFARDRPLGKTAGAKHGWRKLSPLDQAYEKGSLLGCDNDKASEYKRYEAAKQYERLWTASQPGTTDSTQASGSRKGCGGDSGVVNGIDAANKLSQLERSLGAKDRQICCYFIGLEHSPAQAIAMSLGVDFAKSTLPRLREALDALSDALRDSPQRHTSYSR